MRNADNLPVLVPELPRVAFCFDQETVQGWSARNASCCKLHQCEYLGLLKVFHPECTQNYFMLNLFLSGCLYAHLPIFFRAVLQDECIFKFVCQLPVIFLGLNVFTGRELGAFLSKYLLKMTSWILEILNSIAFPFGVIMSIRMICVAYNQILRIKYPRQILKCFYLFISPEIFRKS